VRVLHAVEWNRRLSFGAASPYYVRVLLTAGRQIACLNLKKCDKKGPKKVSTKLLVRLVLLTGSRNEGKVKTMALTLKYQWNWVSQDGVCVWGWRHVSTYSEHQQQMEVTSVFRRPIFSLCLLGKDYNPCFTKRYTTRGIYSIIYRFEKFNPLNAELNPICHLLTLLGAHPIFHISRIRVNCTVYSYTVLVIF